MANTTRTIEVWHKGKPYTIIVDAERYEELNQHKWYLHVGGGHSGKKPYVVRACKKSDAYGNKKHLRMHRSLMGVGRENYQTVQVDHINNDTLDNRVSNLRITTIGSNTRNKPITNKTGFRGVTQTSSGWTASIVIDRERHKLGWFSSPVEAAKAYDAAVYKISGEIAVLNFPNSQT